MIVDRRSVLKGGAGLVGLQLAGLASARVRGLRVGVVGGGIIGCSVAMHLAEAGADVVLFEKNALASGATRNSVAWINPVVLDEHYMRLRIQSVARWRALDRQHGFGAVWGGSVSWTKGPEKGAVLHAKIELLRKLGAEPQTLVDAAAVSVKSPAVDTQGPVSEAMFLPQDGHVDPVFAAQRFAALAARRGARIVQQCEVLAVERRDDAVTGVRTSRGDFAVDRLILVGGTDTPHLLSLVDVPFKLSHAPGLVIKTTPQPVVTKMVYEASGELEFKQYANGQILTSFTEGPPNLPQHAEVRERRIDYPSEALRQRHGRILIERTAPYLPAIAGAAVTDVLLGFRPMPLDKLPVVGPVPGQRNCYVVVTHSGVTLAPVLGDYVAQEVLTGRPVEMLAPYRPERFAKAA